tara:strand:- start:67 stop:555 length:489 start_codon:yes stop_codon:yes gene_type:complete
MNGYQIFIITSACLAVLVFGFFLIFIKPLLAIRFQLFLSGVQIPFSKLVAMRFQKHNVNKIAINLIRLKKADINLFTADDLIAHTEAGGNLNACVSALIASNMHDIPLQWDEITALDLAGIDVLQVAVDAHKTGDLSEIEQLLEQYSPEIAALTAHNQEKSA